MPTSAEIKTALTEKLTKRAVVTAQEPVYVLVGDLLDDALAEHLPDAGTDYAQIPSKELELVMILGWERICLTRASFYAPQPSLNLKSGNPGFGSDRDTPFAKNTALAKLLRLRYSELESSIKDNSEEDDDANASGDITVGEIIRADDILGLKVPYSAAPTIQPVKATLVSANADGSAVFKWTATGFDDYGDTRVLLSPTAAIYQEWNHDGTNGVPYAAAGSSIVFTITNPKGKAIKLTDLAPGDYYVVVVVRSLTDDYAYSNELKITIPAP